MLNLTKKIKLIILIPFTVGILNLSLSPAPVQAVDSGMPDIKNPFDSMQITIPGMDRFTDAKQCSDDEDKLCISWLGEYIVGIYKYAISIVGILATIVMMIGGFIWLTAGGNQSRIGEAKSWIGASLTGLIIALSSYLILYQINPDLTKFAPLKVAWVKPAAKEVTGLVKLSDVSYKFNVKTPGACNGECQLDAALIEKLNKMTDYMYSDMWQVTEAYPPTVKHSSSCHNNGTCADIALTKNSDVCSQVEKFITAAQNAGLTVVNEYSGCKGKKYETTTGNNLHVY